MSRTRRTVLSLLTGVGGSAVTLAVGLLVTPVLLDWLGDERVGVHRITLEWIGYLALLDFGLSGVVQAAVARRLGRGERAEALADIRRATRLFVRVAALQLAALAAFAGAAGLLIRDLTPGTLAELRWGLALASITLVWTPLTVLRPLLDGAQQSYWVNLALLLQTLGTAALSVLFAWLGWGLVGQFAALLVASGGYALFLLLLVRRLYPDLRRRVPPGSHSDPLPVSWPMFLFNLSGRLGVLSDGLILGVALGPAEVVRFYLTQRLLQVAMTQVMAVGNATWAPLADLYHRGEMGQFRRRFAQLNRWTAILAVAALVPLAILNERLVSLWVGPPRYGGDPLTWLTCGQCLVMAQVAFWVWPLVGCGLVRSTLPVMLVGSGLNVAVSVAGTHVAGLLGPAIGSLVGYVAVYYWWHPRLLRQAFGLSRWEVMRELPIALALFAPFAAALWVGSEHLAPHLSGGRGTDFVIWCGLAGLSGLLYLATAWRLLTPPADRRAFLARLTRRA